MICRSKKEGFTFVELIIVVVILSILVSIGAMQYTNTLEKSRTAEAKANLGTIRTMALVYFQENNAYPDDTYLSNTLVLPTGTTYACANTNFFFQYHIDSPTGTATAYRCTSGGKSRNGTVAYYLTLNTAGAGSSNPSGWW